MSKSVGIWIRVSTDHQAQGDSPEVHESRARSFVESKGWTVGEIYNLSGMTGKSVLDYPQAKKMLEDIRSGHISGLVFSKLARLARNTRELLHLADEFENNEADLIALDEEIDTTTPGGRMFFTMRAAAAQWEREEIAARVAASVPARAKMGKPLGGAAPFGYQWLGGEMVPDPQEAPVRRLIYELYLQERTIKGVAKTLNKRGYRTRKGAEFGPSSVRRLLKDTTAKGIRIANYTKSRGDGCAWDLKDESDWVKIPIEPIVDEDLWEECNRLLDAVYEKMTSKRVTGQKVVNLFSGYLYCGRCSENQKLYAYTGDVKYHCRKCRLKIPKDDLEAVFVGQLSAYLVDEKKVGDLLASSQHRMRDLKELLSATETQLTEIEKKISNCMDLYHAGAISIEGVKEQVRPLETQKEELLKSLPRLRRESEVLEKQGEETASILIDGQALSEEWPSFDFNRKREVIEAITERITLGVNEIDFELAYIPGSLSENKRGSQLQGLRAHTRRNFEEKL